MEVHLAIKLVDKILPEFFGSLLIVFYMPRSGDSTARLWPISESGIGSPIVLQHHFKELENHKNMPRDVTSLEWNVRELCFPVNCLYTHDVQFDVIKM